MKKIKKKLMNIITTSVSFFEKQSSKKLILIMMFIFFCLMFVLNKFTPLLADDYSYSFGMKGKKLTSIIDIYHFQIHHYMTWGGRSIVHSIAQFFLILPKIVFNICNSFMYIIFTLVVYKHIMGKNDKHSASIYLLINIALWFSLPVFGQNMLWLIGSCNYLWGTTIMLAFLLPFRLKLDDKKYSNNILLIIGMFLAGIIAGWTNENNAAALLFLIVIFGIYRLYNHKKIPLWQISGFIGTLIGFVVMIMSPGNRIRSDVFRNNRGLLWNFHHRLVDCTNHLIEYMLPLVILLIIISVISYFYGKHKKNNLLVTIIYFLGSMCAVYSMILSPTFPERAWMGPISLLIIALLHATSLLNFKEQFIKTSLIIMVPVLVLSFMASYYTALIDVHSVYRQWNDRINIIENSRKNNKKSLVVETIGTYNYHCALFGLRDLDTNAHLWPNPSVAKYFNIDYININK